MPEKSVVHTKEFMKYKTVVLEVLDRKTWNKFAGYFVNRFKDFYKYRGGHAKLMSALGHIKKTFSSSNVLDAEFRFNFFKKMLSTHYMLLKSVGFEKEGV
jgi:hypothetical protein